MCRRSTALLVTVVGLAVVFLLAACSGADSLSTDTPNIQETVAAAVEATAGAEEAIAATVEATVEARRAAATRSRTP